MLNESKNHTQTFKTNKNSNEEARKYLKHIQTTPDQYCDWKWEKKKNSLMGGLKKN